MARSAIAPVEMWPRQIIRATVHFVRYCRRNPALAVGLVILLFLAGLGLVGRLIVNVDDSAPASVTPNLAPSLTHPFGTDGQGRDLFAALVIGLPLTLQVGFVAGAIGLGVGAVVGFVSGYVGGVLDAIVRVAVDSLLTVPALLILVTIASSIKGFISVNVIALVIASLAWMGPARTIRAQVLTLRGRGYVDIARFSGVGTVGVICRELLPNLLGYLASSFVAAVSTAVLASVGLSALGLGPQNVPTVEMMLYWAIFYGALASGAWWWWVFPGGLVLLLFLGLYFVTSGLDEVANPRRRLGT
ncbi:ABC transporter permease [Actinopolymorpha pittospori]|uniref:Peptide/nickel transport system permease protein n=1 Tax=Actinopolymorpha pittospori TaxID=648752 RepID=A0A927RFX5_9ACTN|nr:ABC transporter permease [Actinopolymorpha pittospori]MBE1603691.1 peptide/nickel transport system permease protein [Actinopolymorpha pittospori]